MEGTRDETSYLCSIVTMALSRKVSEISDFKKYGDLEILVRSHSTSLKRVPLDKSDMLSY